MDNDLRPRFYGVFIGVVAYSKDPEHLGRLQVRVVEAHGTTSDDDSNLDEDLPWASVSTLGGGTYDTGSHIPFPVGASVVVVFEQGDSSRPWVMGGAPKRPLPDEWEYGVDGESMGKWAPKDANTDIPKEVRGDREESKYVLFKTPKGVSVVVEEKDEEEALYIIDRAGQVIEFSCPVLSAENEGNFAQRGEFSAVEGGQLGYSQMAGEARIRLIDLAGQHIKLKAKIGQESVEIINQKRGGADQQRVILDNTVGSEEIRVIDRKGQKIVMKSGSGKHILIESGEARIRLDGEANKVWIHAGEIRENDPSDPGGE